jgi:DNA-binding CsgD family transcriptional regulator
VDGGDGGGVSRREAEVHELVCENLTNAEIGARLYISERTVESHVSSLLRKLGASNRRELARHAPVASDRRSQDGPDAQTALSTTADDRMPNVSRDGLTIVFASNRTDLDGEHGDFDVYVASRSSTAEPWSQTVNLGPNVNMAAAETRPSLSADLDRLYFGRLSDTWMSARAL